MIKNKVIAVDFDGTITDKNNFPECGELKPYVKEALQSIAENGNVICIWTCRNGIYLYEAIDYLNKNEIPYNFVNKSPLDKVNHGCRKIIADYYIDDRNIFSKINWKEIEEYFLCNDN